MDAKMMAGMTGCIHKTQLTFAHADLIPLFHDLHPFFGHGNQRSVRFIKQPVTINRACACFELGRVDHMTGAVGMSQQRGIGQ